MLSVPSKIYWQSDYSGMDSLELCFDKKHFLNYPKRITYEYNSKGFRDNEWPDDLRDVIWCVGDSFTVGLGQPFHETWPQILEQTTRKRCLNIGEDGCSNDTLLLRTQKIYELYRPNIIIIMWSYFSRRRLNGKNVGFDKNNFGLQKDINNFASNLISANSIPTNIINLLVPHALIDFDIYKDKIFYEVMAKYRGIDKKLIEKILIYKQLDRARDYHHFDIKTSQHVCDLILTSLNNFDKILK